MNDGIDDYFDLYDIDDILYYFKDNVLSSEDFDDTLGDDVI